MNRFRVHVLLKNPNKSVAVYSALFGAMCKLATVPPARCGAA